jgi:ubiquinone/menaquinone biosynthesis C-methylase UbiE
VAFGGVGRGDKVLDVGCGPGALTARLHSRGTVTVTAADDPSPPFVDAIRMRLPDVDVRHGTAKEVPYDNGSFDAALAQLVVHFMTDSAVGVRQMARVTRRAVSSQHACATAHRVLAPSWDAVHIIDPDVEDEALPSGGADGTPD